MKEKDLKPNSITYGCLIDACVKNSLISEAMTVYNEMIGKGQKPNTIIFTTLIKGFAKVNNLQMALSIFSEMKESLDQKSLPNNVTYNSLIDCCIRCRDL